MLKSILTQNLSNKNIKDICKLKDTYWKFGIDSQLNYFTKNINSNDIHNCYFLNSKLIGYTLLKIQSSLIKKKNIFFLHFDTLIVDKNFRRKKIGKKLMLFNNKKIQESRYASLLICDENMKNFYIKNSWKIANDTYKTINIYKKGFELMIFNEKSLIK